MPSDDSRCAIASHSRRVRVSMCTRITAGPIRVDGSYHVAGQRHPVVGPERDPLGGGGLGRGEEESCQHGDSRSLPAEPDHTKTVINSASPNFQLPRSATWKFRTFGSWELTERPLPTERRNVVAHRPIEADVERMADERVADRRFVEMRQVAEQREVRRDRDRGRRSRRGRARAPAWPCGHRARSSHGPGPRETRARRFRVELDAIAADRGGPVARRPDRDRRRC